ncbi:MAG TPA: hypothetical protein VKD70_00740 [Candidatus Acidoferrum sp.]|nr:hypothetical protein [Candidatus Acidoferrum sp.]
MKRPTGVTVIVFFFMVSAAVLPAFVLLSPRKDATTFFKSFIMLMSVIEFVLAVRLWKMKNWARISTLILVIIGFVSAVASLRHTYVLYGFAPLFLIKYVLVFPINLSIILYLLSPTIRRAFLTWSER